MEHNAVDDNDDENAYDDDDDDVDDDDDDDDDYDVDDDDDDDDNDDDGEIIQFVYEINVIIINHITVDVIAVTVDGGYSGGIMKQNCWWEDDFLDWVEFKGEEGFGRQIDGCVCDKDSLFR